MDPEKTSNTEQIAPAEGERRAMIGYSNQYEVSAYIIIKALLNDSLDWVKVADPDAKHLDDFQICKGTHLDAFQMKWSRYAQAFSFKDLIKKGEKTPSLIVQLAEGWKNFKEKSPEMKIRVHLVTNNYPSNSTRAKIPCEEPKPTSCHFAAFITQAWKPFKSGRNIPEEWKSAWDKLQMNSGLNPDDFQNFALDCELDFEYKVIIPEEEREKSIFMNDLKDVTHYLIKSVADPSRIIKITRKELIEKLNWSKRTELRSRHEFPIDEDLYHPIKSNINDLNDALDALEGGYIGVFGTPGSGKSTFLSHFLRSREERVIFYYAYVPDSHDSIIRGESENFLHDITLSLRREGFNPGENLNLDLNQLLRYFHKQLDFLHEDWKTNGQKTIFLIDGLDHIEREQHPQDSLLKYLPSPENIPQGVYFVLGSQKDTILHNNIQYSLKNENRKILMDSLNKNAVFDIIDKSNLPLITGAHKETIYNLSDGHPLALSYILNHLKDAKDDKEIERILGRTIQYEGNIEAQYNSYWDSINDREDLIDLTGLLCRSRNYIDIDWVKSWAKIRLLRKFIREFSHYFRKENKRWYFFHNSFRLFLQEKTGEIIPGESDWEMNRNFHLQMADLCHESEKNSYWSWEEIFHLAKANEHHKVLEHASQTYFREQFLNFRPIDAIKIDINFALESAVICQDPVALTRLLFIRSEIGEREVNLDKKSMMSILLHLNDELALEYIRDGNHLRIEPTDALKLIPELVSNGFNDEAKKIFELSEPLNIIYSPKPIEDFSNDDKSELIELWANSAIYFKEVDTILKIIRQLKKLPDHSSLKEDLDPSRSFQNLIIYDMGLSLIENERWDEVLSILNDFNVDQKDLKPLFYLYVNSWDEAHENEDISISKQFLNDCLNRFNKIIIDKDMCLTLAEAFYFICNDAKMSESYLSGLCQPELQTNLHQSSPDMQPFMFRFRLNRLLYCLGSTETPEDIIPDAVDIKLNGISEFERNICILSKMEADAWNGKKLEDEVIYQEIPRFLNLFYIGDREAIDYHLYSIKKRMGDFCILIIDTLSNYGLGALKVLVSVFENEWGNDDVKNFWPSSVRRQIIESLSTYGISHDWVVGELEKVENGIWEGYNIYGRVEECLKQSKVWLLIDETDRSFNSLEKMLKMSFGIYYEKDFQFSTWIEWLDVYIGVYPERAEELIILFADYIAKIRNYAEVSTYNSASNALLTATFKWNPQKALQLSSWLIEQMLITQEGVFSVFIKETLKSDDCNLRLVTLFLSNLLFPLSPYANFKIIDLLLKAINFKYGSRKAIEAANYLVSKIRISAQKKARYNWFYSIKQSMENLGLDVENAGITSKDIHFDEHDGITYNLLKLKDSKVLDTNEVKRHVLSVNDYLKFLDEEIDDSYFDWEPIIINLANKLNSQEILNLSKIILNNDKIDDREFSELISILSQRLSDLNDFDHAIKLGKISLDLSRPGGWGNWSGESRIKAFDALIKANKSQYRPLMYRTLVNDIENSRIDAKTVTLNLRDILGLLTDEIPIKDIWPEIEHHIQILFENYPSDDLESIEFIDLEDEVATLSKALMDLVLSCLNHPIRFISQSAIRICVDLLVKGDVMTQRSINEFFKDESFSEQILIVIDAVSIKDPSKVEFFREKLVLSHTSSNYYIRRISGKLCERIGCRVNDPARIDLPEIYDKTFPDVYNFDIFDFSDMDIPNGQPLPDFDFPEEIIYPYDLRLISKLSKYPEINLSHRIVEIMYLLADFDSWSKDAENKLRIILQSARLRFTFYPPRLILVRRAIFHLICELFDGGKLSSDDLESIDQSFRFYDPKLILNEPMRRPVYIKPAYEEYKSEHLTVPAENWMEMINNCNNAVFRNLNGKFILAENTKLKYIDRNLPTELRKSKVMLNSGNYEKTNNLFFYNVLSNVQEYDDIRLQDDSIPLIIQNKRSIDSDEDDWVALNPLIGNQLGWKLENNGLFRWVDEDNQIMVESKWWKDGLLDQFELSFHEVGEGWLILASEKAFQVLKSRYGLLKREIEIERNLNENGYEVRKSKFEEQFLYKTYFF